MKADVYHSPLHLSAGLLARLHTDDPVPAGGFLHPGGFHPDDGLGQREAPQLPEGVPRLPSSALTHPAFYPVGLLDSSLTLFVGVKNLHPHPPSSKIYTGTEKNLTKSHPPNQILSFPSCFQSTTE